MTPQLPDAVLRRQAKQSQDERLRRLTSLGDAFERVSDNVSSGTIERLFEAYLRCNESMTAWKESRPMTPEKVEIFNRQLSKLSGMQELLRELGFRSYELHVIDDDDREG